MKSVNSHWQKQKKNTHFVQYWTQNRTLISRGGDVWSSSVTYICEWKFPQSVESVRHYATDKVRTPSFP